jgi:hypothetical protein
MFEIISSHLLNQISDSNSTMYVYNLSILSIKMFLKLWRWENYFMKNVSLPLTFFVASKKKCSTWHTAHIENKRLNNFHQNPITEPCLILFFLSCETRDTRESVREEEKHCRRNFQIFVNHCFIFPSEEKHLKPRNDKQWFYF